MARQVKYNDMTIAVPDDASDDEVSAIIETKEQEARVSAQPGNQPGLLERGGRYLAEGGRYLAEWGQGVKDAATQPVGGPTGIPLVDAAAGVADFAASAASDTVTAVPRLARMAFTGARGGKTDPTWLTREPVTPTGKAIQDTAGAVFKPAGDALGATGLPPEAVQFGMELLGTVADAAGLAGAGRGIRLGTRALRPDIPDPGGVPRPFGPEVEQARRLDYRVTPSQVAAKAQANAPIGDFGPSVPGTLREAFTGPDFHVRAIIDNQKRTNAFAARELGLTELTPMGLQFAKNPHNMVFNEVAQSLPVLRSDPELMQAANVLGAARRDNPLLRTTTAVEQVRDRLLNMESVPTQQALDAIRSYRQDASKLFKQAEMGGSGIGVLEAEQAALAYRGAADALEAAIERQAGMLYPDLVPRLRDARTQLAKIHNVEDVFDGTNVDPQALARLSEKYPLSGYLAEIASIARAFPDTMKSATGLDVPIQTQQGALNSISLAARRAVGRSQGPALLDDPFQNRFGRADPNFDPRTPPPEVGGSPFAEFTPPDPNLPGGADVMPPGPVLGPEVGRMGAVGLADEFDTLPPAEALPGDLTAETPPMGGSLPAQDLGLAEALAGPMDVAPQTAGDLPYTPRNPPANPPDDMGLVENAPPPFPRGGPSTPGVALPGPLDEDMAGLGIPPGGALPFAESVGAPPAVQTRPEGMRIGQSLSEGMDLVPEPVANPDMLPPPPDASVGGLDIVNPVEPGADVIDFTSEMLDPALLAGALDLLQQGGLDFQPGDLQLGGRGRTLNPERRNMPRAGGRNTLADELTLEGEGPTPPEPRALPAPAPLRGTESGMVGTPQQFDEMGLGTPGARAAAGDVPLEGELIPAGQSLVDELVGLTDVTPTAAAMPEGPPAATIADELQLAEEPVTRTQPATDLGDDGLKLENLPEQRAGDVGIKRTKRPPADMIPRKPLPPNPVVYYSGPARNPTRWLVMEEKGDVWQIRSIDTTAFKQVNKDHTRPPGQELYALVAKDARDLGKTLHSDTDMTKDAIDATERAVQSGAIVVDDWDNAIAAARAALEKSGGKRISRGASGGEPWFKNIRPGE